VRPEHHDTILRYFPQTKFAEIPESGHWVHAERPDDFLAAVTPFLA
jgi:pimeloyl-ACP methyl ester carboxylesterase